MTDTIEQIGLSIAGTRWYGWSDLEIKRSIDAFTTFAFTAPFEAERAEFRSAFKPFGYNAVTIDTNGELLCTGTMLGVEPKISAEERSVAVSGYSLAGVLGDCTMPASALPIGYRAQGLSAIASALCAPFGIATDVRGQGSETAPFELVTAEATETPFAFLSKLAQQRSMCVADTPAGALLLWAPPASGSPVATFRFGEQPATSITVSLKSQDFYSEITGLKNANGGRAGAKWTEQNPFLSGVFRPQMFGVDDADKGDVQTATLAKLARMIGNAIAVTVEVPTWRDEAGALWEPNAFVTIDAPHCMIYTPTDFVIRDVTYRQSSESTSATLECVLPGVFSGVIPTAIPWA